VSIEDEFFAAATQSTKQSKQDQLYALFYFIWLYLILIPFGPSPLERDLFRRNIWKCGLEAQESTLIF